MKSATGGLNSPSETFMILVTIITFLISDYKHSIVNHATIFAVYFAITLIFKEKVEKYRQGQKA